MNNIKMDVKEIGLEDMNGIESSVSEGTDKTQ
jgi:hypothetical protein